MVMLFKTEQQLLTCALLQQKFVFSEDPLPERSFSYSRSAIALLVEYPSKGPMSAQIY